MSKLFWFLTGSIAGAYVAQNYEIPSISECISNLKKRMSDLEIEAKKKPPKQ